MGATASRVPSKGWMPKSSAGRIYSFDALGTIYDFKEPVALQYAKVAQKCGVAGNINEHNVAEAFQKAYKQTNTDFPNYGKGTLSNPVAWWDLLVHRTFRQVVPNANLPGDLGYAMYQHFASGAAYKLRPDAVSAFNRKKRWNQRAILEDRTTKMRRKVVLVCCVITNSDPRVADILRDLGLKVGSVIPASAEAPPSLKDFDSKDYDPGNDIDFVCTSYEAGSEKPDQRIFDHARRQAVTVCGGFLFRYAAELERLFPGYNHFSIEQKMIWLPDPTHFEDSQWIHLGNEYEKDSRGAINAGVMPAHLCTDGKLWEWQEKLQKQGGFAVKHLPDVFDYQRDK